MRLSLPPTPRNSSFPLPPFSESLPAAPSIRLASVLPVPEKRRRRCTAGSRRCSQAYAGQSCADGIVALALELGDHVAGLGHDIGVIADPADHAVGAAPAVERVVGGAAGQRVRRRIALAVEVAATDEGKVFDFAELIEHMLASVVWMVSVPSPASSVTTSPKSSTV